MYVCMMTPAALVGNASRRLRNLTPCQVMVKTQLPLVSHSGGPCGWRLDDQR